jgi:hypothetical protein
MSSWLHCVNKKPAQSWERCGKNLLRTAHKDNQEDTGGSMRISRVMAGLILAGISCGSQAATVTYTGTYSGVTDVTNQVINVAQFNPLLGTLVSATFELTGTMTTSASFSGDASYYAGWDKMTYQLWFFISR